MITRVPSCFILFVALVGSTLNALSEVLPGFRYQVPREALLVRSSEERSEDAKAPTCDRVLSFQALTNFPGERDLSYLVGTAYGQDSAFVLTHFAVVHRDAELLSWVAGKSPGKTPTALAGFYDEANAVRVASNSVILVLSKGLQRGLGGLDIFSLSNSTAELIYKDQRGETDREYIFANVLGDNSLEMLCNEAPRTAVQAVRVWSWANESRTFVELKLSEAILKSVSARAAASSVVRLTFGNPKEIPPRSENRTPQVNP